jgi:putative phosphoribosyl transferase
LRPEADSLILGIARGGVVVAGAVAQALQAPLDVIVIRKVGHPMQPELAIGAVSAHGDAVATEHAAGFGQPVLQSLFNRTRSAAEALETRLRGDTPPMPLRGRPVIIVDDGIATGATARAACQVARAQGASRVVLAVPVAPPSVRVALVPAADEVICVETPRHFLAIGEWYQDFAQTGDQEVVALLRAADGGGPAAATPAPWFVPVSRSAQGGEVVIDTGQVRLTGELSVPGPVGGMVLFAHGSGSSRHSPRNRYVAGVLAAAGLGTLLFDLLTAGEERDRANVFDIGLLAERLTVATRWLRERPGLAGTRLGYFGASTGAAAALWAAADPANEAAAVVSRGGRPDLAAPRLLSVRAPTLLIVGELDTVVLGMNRAAQVYLRCENDLAVVPGAAHLFAEPGTLEQAAELARDWFTRHLAAAPAPA